MASTPPPGLCSGWPCSGWPHAQVGLALVAPVRLGSHTQVSPTQVGSCTGGPKSGCPAQVGPAQVGPVQVGSSGGLSLRIWPRAGSGARCACAFTDDPQHLVTSHGCAHQPAFAANQSATSNTMPKTRACEDRRQQRAHAVAPVRESPASRSARRKVLTRPRSTMAVQEDHDALAGQEHRCGVRARPDVVADAGQGEEALAASTPTPFDAAGEDVRNRGRSRRTPRGPDAGPTLRAQSPRVSRGMWLATADGSAVGATAFGTAVMVLVLHCGTFLVRPPAALRTQWRGSCSVEPPGRRGATADPAECAGDDDGRARGRRRIDEGLGVGRGG